MTIRISKFNKESKEQFMKSNRSLLGSEIKPPNGLVEDDICILYDFESKEYFGIVKIGLFENNLTFRENPISEIQGVYDGKYSKYSKYEINIKNFYLFKMNIEKLIKVLGINSKEYNLIDLAIILFIFEYIVSFSSFISKNKYFFISILNILDQV